MDIPFVMDQSFNAPADKVWEALTDENKMKDWYFPQLRNWLPVSQAQGRVESDS